MIRVKSTNYPAGNPFKIFQDYAWWYYMVLFSTLMLILFFQLARRGPILMPGVAGIFGTVVFSNVLAVVRMKKERAEIGFHEKHFFIRSVYQVLMRKEPAFFPLPYANPRISGDVLYITYFDNIVVLDKEEWEDWDEMLYYFGLRKYL